jgi:hypothetical protein
VCGYDEWPKNTPNYWALPAMADSVGWTYRKDWFAKPELQAEFKKKVADKGTAKEALERMAPLSPSFTLSRFRQRAANGRGDERWPCRPGFAFDGIDHRRTL